MQQLALQSGEVDSEFLSRRRHALKDVFFVESGSSDETGYSALTIKPPCLSTSDVPVVIMAALFRVGRSSHRMDNRSLK